MRQARHLPQRWYWSIVVQVRDLIRQFTQGTPNCNTNPKATVFGIPKEPVLETAELITSRLTAAGSLLPPVYGEAWAKGHATGTPDSTFPRCQKCKVSRHTKSKLGEFEQPDERFSVVHIDLIGKLPPSEGMQYCLTCIDRISCWMEAIPIPEITAEIVGRAFYEKWIGRFGVPAKLVTDQGRQFEAELFRSIAAICGAKVAHTTSYHPQCNGKVERLHRTLKGAIKAHNNIRWT
ncbi:retrovirus-related Pol polyprotein from transposon opus [Trichonephila clavipes]|nr:retrovirus-related Pol polyprotein from transposon opus [Trichonephila clavipes]